jgi:hypothetical protein
MAWHAAHSPKGGCAFTGFRGVLERVRLDGDALLFVRFLCVIPATSQV